MFILVLVKVPISGAHSLSLHLPYKSYETTFARICFFILITLRGPRIPGFGFPRTLYAVQSKQSYCFPSHATNRVVLDKIFSNANSNYFRGKLKIETVLNKKKITRYGQRFPQGYIAYGGSG